MPPYTRDELLLLLELLNDEIYRAQRLNETLRVEKLQIVAAKTKHQLGVAR